MTYTLSLTYMGCQTCQTRVHCDECEARLEKAMMRLKSVYGVSIQMAKKNLIIETDMDIDSLTDSLEDLGVFIE